MNGHAPRHDEPQVRTRLPPSSFADDEPRDLDVICRIKTPIQAVPDLVNKFVFSWTALAFNDDGVGTFEGVSDKNVDNLPHRHTPPIGGPAQAEGRSRAARRCDVNRLGGAACLSFALG